MLLLSVARQYYEFGMGQSAIAQATGYSRPTIGRMLAEAKARGIVHIQLHHPLERVTELETAIRNRFGVSYVRVVAPSNPQQEGIDQVAQACAALLDVVVQSGTSLGTSNGRVHSALLDHVKSHRYDDVTVVQMVGGLENATRLLDTPEVCRRLARTYGGTAVIHAAPLIAASERAARDHRRTPAVTRTLGRAKTVEVAVIGIGAGFRFPASVFDGVISKETVRDLHRNGAVGHLLGRFIDSSGLPVETPLNRRVIGAELQWLRDTPMVVGVAAGTQKAPAIAAALRGGYLDVLLIDVGAAQALAYIPEAGRPL